MTSRNDGAAREVAPGRLAHFEDDEELSEATLSLPARPRRKTSSQPGTAGRATKPARSSAETGNGPARDRRTEQASVAEEPPGGVKGMEDKIRPSNVHVPVALIAPITAKCKAEGMSHGEVIISALEATQSQLRDLIHPAATAGGSLFASRRSRASRATDGPLTPLNYRLRNADFDILDQLVDEFGASSRGHLITTALTAYFHITDRDDNT